MMKRRINLLNQLGLPAGTAEITADGHPGYVSVYGVLYVAQEPNFQQPVTYWKEVPVVAGAMVAAAVAA